MNTPKQPHQLLSRAEAYVTTHNPPTAGRRGELVIDLEGMLVDIIILLKASGVPKAEFLTKCNILFDAVRVDALDLSKCEVVFAAPTSTSTH